MLVGRDALLSAGERAVADALTGRGGLLLLTGEAGIGKSTLAQAIAERAEDAGATLRVGGCWETEALPPFTPWLDALRRPAHAGLPALMQRMAAGDEAAVDAASAGRARGRLFADISDSLHELSEETPQVIVLEDLHWADVASLELLAAIGGRLRAMAMLVIGTFRDEEMSRPNPLVALGGAAERMPLTGLDRGAVADIVATVTGRPRDEDVAAALRERTGGNPLFVTELARLLDAGSQGMPTGVQDVLERRLARVSSDCAATLGAAAVLGHEFDRGQLATLVEGDPVAALDEARAARLVEPSGDDPLRHRFVHVLVQATRYEGLSAPEREALHRRAVEVLRGQRGVTAAALAHHAVRARFDVGDPMPAELLVAAGEEALAGLAWTEADAAFERALALAPAGPPGDAVRAEAWLGIGHARVRTDQTDVRDAFAEAAALARRLGRPDVLARAALGFSVGLGAFEVRLLDHAQIELLEEAAAALDESDPLLAVVLARLSVALAFTGSDARRAELALRAVDLARASNDRVVLGHALAARCDAFADPEHVDERLAASDEIIELGLRQGDVPLELVGRRLRVVALFEGLRFPEIDVEIDRFERAADALGDPLYAWYVPLWRAARAVSDGQVAEARRLAREATAIGGRGGSQNSALLGAVFELMVGLETRDRAAAVAGFDGMLRLIPDTLVEFFSLSRGYLEARLGDLERARALMQEVSDDAYDGIPYDSEWVPVMCQLAVGASLTGDTRLGGRARAALSRFPGIGAIEGIGAYCHGPVDRYLAMVAAVDGDAEATRGHVEGALALVRAGGTLLEALTALDAAWSLLRAGDPDDEATARQLARRAHQAFTEMGLAALVAEAAVLGGGGPAAPIPSTLEPGSPRLAREGDTWAVTWEGRTVHVKHAKGVADLATLLDRPRREVHVRELEGVVVAGSSSTQPALDDTAVRQYRQRLSDLEEDLDEADQHGDTERAARLAIERDGLIDELTRAFGLGGRARGIGNDPDERLRKAVSARVKASVERLEALHPPLGRHLRVSVRTGFWCAYEPERPVSWTVER